MTQTAMKSICLTYRKTRGSEFLGKLVRSHKSEMPDFDEKYKELGEDIHFLMVNLTDGSGNS